MISRYDKFIYQDLADEWAEAMGYRRKQRPRAHYVVCHLPHTGGPDMGGYRPIPRHQVTVRPALRRKVRYGLAVPLLALWVLVLAAWVATLADGMYGAAFVGLVTTLGPLTWWLVRTAVLFRRDTAVSARDADLIARCDQENQWYLAGDPRGIYGPDYWAVTDYLHNPKDSK